MHELSECHVLLLPGCWEFGADDEARVWNASRLFVSVAGSQECQGRTEQDVYLSRAQVIKILFHLPLDSTSYLPF